jgi:hypothetical protein
MHKSSAKAWRLGITSCERRIGPGSILTVGVMIAYDLQCGNGHAFEGWFEDSAAFNAQKKKGLIACPVCNDTDIVKLPSRFAIKTSSGFKPKEGDSQEDQAMAQLGRLVVDFVQKNFDNVGCQFASEALKIHYGVTEPRNIRGVSTQEEEKLLKQEGVQFIKVPLPAPPEPETS